MAMVAGIRDVLVGHHWQDLSEWVRAVDELANMSDDEIDDLAAPEPAYFPTAA